MDSEGSSAVTNKKNRYNKGSMKWRSQVNGNLIKFRNLKCDCRVRAAVQMSETEDNPNKLFYNCPYDACDFFQWCCPEPSDFDNGAFFEGHRSCTVAQ